eukprot:54365_1
MHLYASPANESEPEDTDDDPDQQHPLDSSSRCNNWLNSFFMVWVYKIVQMGEIKFQDITTMPKYMRAHHRYKVWKRHSNRRIRSTLSTIWSVHKFTIIQMTLLQIVYIVIIGISYYVFINLLFHVFTSIHTHDDDLYLLLPELTRCAIYLFLLLMLSTILEQYQRSLAYRVQGQVLSCLYLDIYDKTLSLDMNESDKQQVVSIIGSDIPLINEAIVWVSGSAVSLICALFLVI